MRDGWGGVQWRGVVVGHPSRYSLEIDEGNGRRRIGSTSLVEVGEMGWVLDTIEDVKNAAVGAGYDPTANPGDIIRQFAWDLSQAQTENNGLVDVVAMQTDLIGELQAQADDNVKRAAAADDLAEQIVDAADLVSDLCMALGYGRRPLVPTGIRELDALVEHVGL